MQKAIREYGKSVVITGFRDIEIDDLELWIKNVQTENVHGVAVQFFNANIVATWEHLYFAALNALTAFATHRKLSRNLAMETMLYASAQRQIRKAIELIGVKRGTANIAVTIICDNMSQVEKALFTIQKRLGKKPDDSVLELSKSKIEHVRKAFGISDNEIKAVMEKCRIERALVNLVVERVALLSTQL